MDLGELINFCFCLLMERVDLYLGIPEKTLEWLANLGLQMQGNTYEKCAAVLVKKKSA